jgi:hypothetical protein
MDKSFNKAMNKSFKQAKQAMEEKEKVLKLIAEKFIKNNYNISLKDFPKDLPEDFPEDFSEDPQLLLKNVFNKTIFDFVRNDKMTLQEFDKRVKNIIFYFLKKNQDLILFTISFKSNTIPFFSDGDYYGTNYTILKLINLAIKDEENQARKEKLDRLLDILGGNPKKRKHTSEPETEHATEPADEMF